MRHTTILFLSLTLALTACRQATVPGPSTTPEASTPDTASSLSKQIYGVVTWNGPVVAATVNVTDLNGTVLGTTQTNDKGGFVLPLATTPPINYRVVANGGTTFNKPFDGTLQAEARNRPATQTAVQVNPATTLISLHVQETAGLTAEAATTQVKTFLELPPSITSDIYLTPGVFNAAQFAQEAELTGGSTLFLKTLLTELKSGKTHPFKRPLESAAGDDAADTLAATIFKGVGNGVLSAVGGEIGTFALGQFMSAVGLGEPSAASMHAEEMAALNQISGQITALSNQVTSVQNELDLRINTAAYKALQNGAAADLIVRNQTVLQQMSDIEAISGDTDAAKQAQKNQLAILTKYIGDNMVTGKNIMVEWQAALAGVGPTSAGDGLLVTWQKLVSQGSPDKWGPDQAQAVQKQWEFFDGQQLQSMVYVINYMKANPDTYPVSSQIKLVRDWQANRKRQMALIRGNSAQSDTVSLPVGSTTEEDMTTFQALPLGTVIDRNAKLMWSIQPKHLKYADWHTGHPILVNYIGDFSYDNIWNTIYGQAASELASQTGVDGWRFPPTPKRFIDPKTHGVTGLFPPADLFKDMRALGVVVNDSDNVVFDLKIGGMLEELKMSLQDSNDFGDLAKTFLMALFNKTQELCALSNQSYGYSNLTMNSSNSFFYGLLDDTAILFDGRLPISFAKTNCPAIINNFPSQAITPPQGALPWEITMIFQRDNKIDYWYNQ